MVNFFVTISCFLFKIKNTYLLNYHIHHFISVYFTESFLLGHKRDWTLMHRYIYHVLHLKDGTRISVGVVSQPCTSSHLEMGYILLPNKDLYPIKGCSLKLYQHGENGTPPQSLAFSITTAVRTYRVKVDVEFEEVHYKGSDKEAKMVERFVRCLVNGVEGRGVSEWHYNHAEYK